MNEKQKRLHQTFLQAKTFTKRIKTNVNKDTSEVMENGDWKNG
jgi:hypothetical protein